MATLSLATIVVLIVIIAALTVALLSRQFADIERRLRALEAQLPKRHTHRNAMTIENVLAQAIRAKLDLVEAQEMVDTLMAVLQSWRNDPGYDPEKPTRR